MDSKAVFPIGNLACRQGQEGEGSHGRHHTVQEKNISFPTDAKRYQKVMKQCPTLAQRCGMKLRKSYWLVAQRPEYEQSDAHLARHAKKAQRALKKLSTLAGSSASS
jgi:hypothetical protein